MNKFYLYGADGFEIISNPVQISRVSDDELLLSTALMLYRSVSSDPLDTILTRTAADLRVSREEMRVAFWEVIRNIVKEGASS